MELKIEVALRKESVDRNFIALPHILSLVQVALRKESVDRNIMSCTPATVAKRSLSARRAWIEMLLCRKRHYFGLSLSARRAWIEIVALHGRPARL